MCDTSTLLLIILNGMLTLRLASSSLPLHSVGRRRVASRLLELQNQVDKRPTPPQLFGVAPRPHVRLCSSSTTKVVEFPWRHQLDPPERILDNDVLSGMPNNFRARLVRRLVACREMNLSAFEAVPLPFGMKFTWERELAENFAIAFGFAVEELLMNVFGGRVQVDKKGGSIYGLADTTEGTDTES